MSPPEPQTMRDRVLFLIVSALLAAALSVWTDLPFLVAFPIIVFAILVNGLVATLEDDLPGGFNNPDGTATPPYVARVARIVRWTAVVFLWPFVAIAAYAIVVASDRSSRWSAAGLTVIFLAAALFMTRRLLGSLREPCDRLKT